MAWTQQHWFDSYLSRISQQVFNEGLMLPLEVGVSQRSVLGPLLYILFTNYFPDFPYQTRLENQEGDHSQHEVIM